MRPRVFDPGARSSINIYLHPDQLTFLKKRAHGYGVSPSVLIRNYIDKLIAIEELK
jgi:hypothetical protein